MGKVNNSVFFRRIFRIITGALVATVLSWTIYHIDFAEVLVHLREVDLVLVAFASLLVLVPLGLRSLRSAFLFSKAGYTVPLWKIAAITVFGFSMTSVTPGGSGDFLRVAALKDQNVGALDSAAIIVYERVLDAIVIVAYFAIAFPITLGSWGALAVMGYAACVLIALLLILILLPRPSMGILVRLLPKITRRLSPNETTQQLIVPQILVVSLGFTLLMFGSVWLRSFLFIQSMGIEVGIFQTWVIFALPFFATVVSLIPLGLGSWEAAAVWTFAFYGFDTSESAAATVVLRIGLTVPAILVGTIAWPLSLGWTPRLRRTKLWRTNR